MTDETLTTPQGDSKTPVDAESTVTPGAAPWLGPTACRCPAPSSPPLRAIEKDRARRYETANGLAADLRRHLVHEPVQVGTPRAK